MNFPETIPTTLQEVFNIVWERAKDKVRSGINHRCFYRDPQKDSACFIGACMPQDRYDRELEDKFASSDYFMSYFPEWGSFACELDELQRIHDSSNPEMWNSELVAFAQSNNLTIPQ